MLNISGLGQNDASFAIHDMTGRTIKQGQILDDAIGLDGLASGNYILHIVGSDFTLDRKFVKL